MNDIIDKITNALSTPSSKYLVWYSNLMITRKDVKKQKYLEGHHIFPNFIFGDINTLVYLTFREHYLAHMFLALHIQSTIGNRNKFFMKATTPLARMKGLMKNQYKQVDCRPYSRTFEIAKRLCVDGMSGENNPFYGKKHSKETIEKITLANLNRTWSPDLETRKRMGLGGKKCIGTVTVTDDVREIRLSKQAAIEFLNNNPTFRYGIKKTEARIAAYKLVSEKIKGTKRPKGEDSCHYGMSTITHKETRHRLRVPLSEIETWYEKGYVRGFDRSETESIEHGIKISETWKGRQFSEKQKLSNLRINKDPEKIRKSAEKHRGMKRSEETKKRLSEACKGRKPHNTGKMVYHQFIDGIKKLLHLQKGCIPPEGWIKGSGPLNTPRKQGNKNDNKK